MPEHDIGQQSPQPAAPTAPQFAPPGASSTPATAPAPQFAPPAPPAPQFAPPAFPAPQIAPPPAASAYAPASSQPQRSSSRKTVTWIVVGSILVFAVFIAAIIALVVFIAGEVRERQLGAPLVAGESTTVEAQSPLECDDKCLQLDGTLLFSSDFAQYGITDKTSDAFASSPQAEIDAMKVAFFDVEGAPLECAVTYGTGPVTLDVSSDTDPSVESITVADGYGDPAGANYLQQSLREFDNSADAEAYLRDIRAEIEACPTYSSKDATTGFTFDTRVSVAGGLDLPDSVAAAGWVESAPQSRYYAFDVQRGNSVIRTTLMSYDGLSEEKFREIVETTAQRLSHVTPISE